jgi:hypothetical protein
MPAKSRACRRQHVPHWINPSESIGWPNRRQVEQRPYPVRLAAIRSIPAAMPRAHNTTTAIPGQPTGVMLAQSGNGWGRLR